jgi:hypothetical protein
MRETIIVLGIAWFGLTACSGTPHQGPASNASPIGRIEKADLTAEAVKADHQACYFNALHAAVPVPARTAVSGHQPEPAETHYRFWRLYADCLHTRGYTVTYREGCELTQPDAVLWERHC